MRLQLLRVGLRSLNFITDFLRTGVNNNINTDINYCKD